MTTFIKIPFASSGDKTNPPDTDAAGGVNWTQGYPIAYSKDPATDPSAKRIEREYMNGLFNRLSTAINEIQTSGIAPFITSADNGGSPFVYSKGALVSLGGVNYISSADNNTTTPPNAAWFALPGQIQPLDATLTALAGLVNGANKLPYFSGVDQMAATDLTSFARGLLGKTDAATAKAHLGVGSAGGRNVGAGFSAGGSEIPDMTFFAGLKGSAGYQYSPTGILLQWGTVGLQSAPSGTSIGTFPIAFPAACQQIVVTHDNPLSNVMAFGAAGIVNPTQFRVNAIAINADTFTLAPGYNLSLRWFAIGS